MHTPWVAGWESASGSTDTGRGGLSGDYRSLVGTYFGRTNFMVCTEISDVAVDDGI